jgi:hypothetical protein
MSARRSTRTRQTQFRFVVQFFSLNYRTECCFHRHYSWRCCHLFRFAWNSPVLFTQTVESFVFESQHCSRSYICTKSLSSRPLPAFWLRSHRWTSAADGHVALNSQLLSVQWSLSWARWIQSTPSTPSHTVYRTVLLLNTHRLKSCEVVSTHTLQNRPQSSYSVSEHWVRAYEFRS